MKKLLAIALVLLLAGGGAGAYFFMGQDAVASTPSDKEQKAAEAKNSNPETIEFVELDPLILPIVDKTGVTQTISMVIVLEVADAEQKAFVEKMAPRLKDAYIQELYGVLNYKAALQGGVVQVGEVKKRLGSISAHVLGDHVVNDVLLQVVSQRPV